MLLKISATGLGGFLLLASASGALLAANTGTAAAPVAAGRAWCRTTPRYAGTYTVTDKGVCALSITVTRQAGGYRFRTGRRSGLVTISRQGADTYFTFVGLKGAEPVVDVEAAWADSVLMIQNYGNAMNPYLRFRQCDAKYLTLRRQP